VRGEKGDLYERRPGHRRLTQDESSQRRTCTKEGKKRRKGTVLKAKRKKGADVSLSPTPKGKR